MTGQLTRVLKELHVYVDYCDSRGTEFIDMDARTRYICNFLERRLKPLRYKTPGFSSICIIGYSDPAERCFINSCSVIEVPLHFDAHGHRSLSDEGLTALACSMLRSGLKKCNAEYEIPLNELVEWLKEFEELGYVNEWTHCSRLARGFGLRWTIDCSFTMHEFRLGLSVAKEDEVVFSEEIFRTRGDEFSWVPLFTAAKLKDGKILVFGKGQMLVYEFDLATLRGVRTEFLESWPTI